MKTNRDWRHWSVWAMLGGLAAMTAIGGCDSSGTIDDNPGGDAGAGGAAGGDGGGAGADTDGGAGAAGSNDAGADGSDGSTDTTDASDDAAAEAATDGDGDTGTDAGALAPSFVVHALSTGGHDRLFGVTFDAEGNIVATGVRADGTDADADFETLVARFLPDGTLDATFGEGGWVSRNLAVGKNGEVARGVVVQSTGKIVVAATIEREGAADARDRDIALARFSADGALDATFGKGGVAVLDLSTGVEDGTNFRADAQWGLALAKDDKLVVSGALVASGRTDTDYALVRLDADGAYDATFGTNGVFSLDINGAQASARGVTVLPDDSVVMAGYMSDSGVTMPVLFKVTQAGALDATFGVNGVFSEIVLAASTEAYGAALQGTSFVTVGYGRESTSDDLDWISLRVTSAGKLDTTYGDGGKVVLDAAGFNDNGRALAVLPDDRVLLVGGGRTDKAAADGMIAILGVNGAPDTTLGPKGIRLFDFGGPNDFLWAAAVAPDGELAVAVGLRGGNTDADAGAVEDDDAALVLVPLR